MADIFISYARSTAPQAQQIAQALRGLGYQVWRDDELPAHRSYAEVIEERLKAAKAVVVIWSAEAIKSEWVQSEADRARNDRKLVQLSVDGTPLPMPFDRIQCADLSGWTGDRNAPGWRKIVSSIADLVGGASSAPTPTAQSERAGISVCVLPFANMSNDAEQEYFADGISEDIITDLSKVSALLVIARNTAFTFKGKAVDVKEVARLLDVSHVLEGSVRKSGNRVRITAQLIDGKTGGHIWAERYDRDLADIFALQDEISEAIVRALKVKLLPEEKQAIENRGTTNLEAYDLFLRARTLYSQLSWESVKRGIDLLHQAMALDPKFIEAHELLYQALGVYAIMTPEHGGEARKEASEVLDRLITLAPAPHARVMQLVEAGDYWAAERLIESTGESHRVMSFPEGGGYAVRFVLDLAVGRFECLLDDVREMGRRDPLNRITSWMLRDLLDITGRPDEAEAVSERSRDLPGDRGFIELLAFCRMKGRANPETLKAQYERFLTSCGPEMRVPIFDQLAPVLLDFQAARPLVRQAIDDPAYQDLARLIWLSLLAGFFDATDEALTAMRRAYVDMGGGHNMRVLWYLWMPVLGEARKDARFKSIVRDLGLYDYWRKSGHWGDFARPLGEDDFEIIA